MRARLLSLVAVVAVWWILSLSASELGFPGPIRVLAAFADLIVSGRLLSALAFTLSSFAVGAVLAVAVGVPLGLLMGVRPSLGLVLDPYLTALYVMPFAAIVPLLVLWFGIDELVRVVFIFLFTLPQVAIVCYQGAKSTPTTQIEVARTFLASERQIFWKVVVPHEIPFIFTALRLGVGLAIQGLVVSELLIASVRGLGYLIGIASATLDLSTVLAVVLFVMLLGIAAVALTQRIENSVAPWRRGMTIDAGDSSG
jgi:ABC-type nitrate/sulfonate/bicarbonate transport system permease component